jgi:hypothetical protein
MNHELTVLPSWTTASFGDPADTSPVELKALHEHLTLCKGAQGPLFGLRCAAERMHGFVAPRLVTTLVMAGAVIAAISLVL